HVDRLVVPVLAVDCTPRHGSLPTLPIRSAGEPRQHLLPPPLASGRCGFRPHGRNWRAPSRRGTWGRLRRTACSLCCLQQILEPLSAGGQLYVSSIRRPVPTTTCMTVR